MFLCVVCEAEEGEGSDKELVEDMKGKGVGLEGLEEKSKEDWINRERDEERITRASLVQPIEWLLRRRNRTFDGIINYALPSSPWPWMKPRLVQDDHTFLDAHQRPLGTVRHSSPLYVFSGTRRDTGRSSRGAEGGSGMTGRRATRGK